MYVCVCVCVCVCVNDQRKRNKQRSSLPNPYTMGKIQDKVTF